MCLPALTVIHGNVRRVFHFFLPSQMYVTNLCLTGGVELEVLS